MLFHFLTIVVIKATINSQNQTKNMKWNEKSEWEKWYNPNMLYRKRN